MDVGSVLWGVASSFLTCAVIVGLYKLGQRLPAAGQPVWLALLLIVGLAALMAWYSGDHLGTHTEDDGYEVVDYEPTDRERNEHALGRFLFLVIPAGAGAVSTVFASTSRAPTTPGESLGGVR